MKTTIISLVIVAVATLSSLPVHSQITDAASQHEVEYQGDTKYKDFRIAVGVGYAHRLGANQTTYNYLVDELNKNLRQGFAFDGDVQYFFKEKWGLGLNANLVATTASIGGYTVKGDSWSPWLRLDERERILYIGPTYVTRTETDKLLLVTSLGVGPIFIWDKMFVSGVEANATKTTFGANAGLSGEYKIGSKMGAGLKLACTVGSIGSMNFEGRSVKSNERISVSHFMASLFLSFRTW